MTSTAHRILNFFGLGMVRLLGGTLTEFFSNQGHQGPSFIAEHSAAGDWAVFVPSLRCIST